MRPLLTICIILPLLAILCWNDCKFRRLPNAYTLGLAALGIVWRVCWGGFNGLVDGILGGLVCFAFLLIPFLLNGAGGGDLKMMFAVGIFTGFRFCCAEMIFVSFAGLLLGLAMLMFGAVKSQRLKHWFRCVFDWRYDRKKGAAELPDKNDERGRVPFGVAIAVGTIVTLAYQILVEKPL